MDVLVKCCQILAGLHIFRCPFILNQYIKSPRICSHVSNRELFPPTLTSALMYFMVTVGIKRIVGSMVFHYAGWKCQYYNDWTGVKKGEWKVPLGRSTVYCISQSTALTTIFLEHIFNSFGEGIFWPTLCLQRKNRMKYVTIILARRRSSVLEQPWWRANGFI